MKATIYERIAGDRIAHLVPPAYREAAEEGTRPDGVYTLLLFAHAPRDVVHSAPVRRALKRLRDPAPDGALAVGTVFTVEALEALAERGVRPVVFRAAYWTDESARARQLP